jgi:hypothetical protein
MTSRMTTDLAAKAKGDKSRLIKRKPAEGMYALVPQILYVW